MAGMELCETGFVLSATQAPSGAADLYKPVSSTADIGMPINSHTYLGTGDYQDLIDSDKHQAVILPVAMPLPFAHSIPMGKIFHLKRGFRGFRQQLVDMVGDDTGTDTVSRLAWIEDSPCVEEWLDAVSANPSKFVVSFIARSSIAESLVVPPENTEGELAMITADSLAPILWIDYTIARNLQRDNILATTSSTVAAEYQRLEDRQLENFQRSSDDPPSFGFPSILANGAIWPLRPPAAPSTRAKFGLDSFLRPEVIPPQTSPYQMVEIPTVARLPKSYAIVPLETISEVEEAIAEAAPSTTPSQERARLRLESAKRKRQPQGADSPQRPPQQQMMSATTTLGSLSGAASRDPGNPFVTPISNGTRIDSISQVEASTGDVDDVQHILRSIVARCRASAGAPLATSATGATVQSIVLSQSKRPLVLLR